MATMASNRIPPAPVEDPTNKAFFDGCREGKLLIGRCLDTGKPFFYPRGISPFTLSTNVRLEPSKGEGVIYSWSIQRGKDPYCLAYVTLDEGVTMMTNIVDCDLDTIRCGQRVRLVWKPSDGGPPLPMFTPV
ncbi:MAG: OB-fold domain-containing protein [Rhodovarius sp.]|nr:OB-fold domain-containing protein [Rhodovarius sp.]MCX7931064.1 OB-fold domain-containing protein [Rhodovarius sp.]MDW8314896.1 OB-fold domain-containing protein [Rhodovarius sp.]